ncbi:MAG: hypothetical protein AAFX94_02175 [Myxococcota bacterium]
MVGIWTCDSTGEFETTTNANGQYYFNPYSSTSSDVEDSLIVPVGPIAISVTSSVGSFVTRRNHAYDETCTIPHEGSAQSLPCKIHDVEIEPMSASEFLEAQVAFLEEECGF